MKVNVFLNGEYYLGNVQKADKNIACDGAYRFCQENNIAVDTVLGDFDSLGYVPNKAIKLEVKKDFTDGEYALELVKDCASEITFYNFGGGREDHFMGNLSLLVKCDMLKIRAKAITNYSEIYLVSNSLTINGVKGKTVSIVPFGKSAHIIKGSGFSYKVDNLTLCAEKTLGISNETYLDKVSLTIGEGAVFVFVNNTITK